LLVAAADFLLAGPAGDVGAVFGGEVDPVGFPGVVVAEVFVAFGEGVFGAGGGVAVGFAVAGEGEGVVADALEGVGVLVEAGEDAGGEFFEFEAGGETAEAFEGGFFAASVLDKAEG